MPATAATLDALAAITTARTPGRSADPVEQLTPIGPKEGQVDIEAVVQKRRSPPQALPACLITRLMPHQAEGLTWLQESWTSGSPFVLLADDMGLGKTLQGLAFLAWLRDGIATGAVAKHPLLIVAPTGLLENWRAEHDRHLQPPGLGTLLRAFGKGLSEIRVNTADGTSGLDLAAIEAADWILTTYETLRDDSRDFAAVRFTTMLMDEAQKVKTPAIRMTDAAKAMNADFRIALTVHPSRTGWRMYGASWMAWHLGISAICGGSAQGLKVRMPGKS